MRYIYLHGFCSGPGTFKGNFFGARFAQRGVALAKPDLNLPDFEHLTLSAQVEAIRDLARGQAGPVALIGSSLGGYVACLAAQELEAVARLVLIAPAFGFPARYLEFIGPEAHDTWRRGGTLAVEHYEYKTECALHYGLIEDARRHESRPLGRRLPTLIFHGLHDEVVPLAASLAHLERNPMAELIVLNSDHSLNEDIERVWGHMVPFLFGSAGA